jgi:hypothetical protein
MGFTGRTRIVAGLVGACVFGGLGCWIAGAKHRGGGDGFILGLLFGPFGCLIEALLPNGKPPAPPKPPPAKTTEQLLKEVADRVRRAEWRRLREEQEAKDTAEQEERVRQKPEAIRARLGRAVRYVGRPARLGRLRGYRSHLSEPRFGSPTSPQEAMRPATHSGRRHQSRRSIGIAWARRPGNKVVAAQVAKYLLAHDPLPPPHGSELSLLGRGGEDGSQGSALNPRRSIAVSGEYSIRWGESLELSRLLARWGLIKHSTSVPRLLAQ